jgi:phosphatidate phosphatase APP1
LRKLAKASVLKSLLRAFPLRQFVLVGDSGERDPEIYGSLARRFGAQITQIFIREVPQRDMGVSRWEKAFHGLTHTAWQVFHSPADLPNLLTR